MYELWRILKRNPITWYPRAFAATVFSYCTLSLIQAWRKPIAWGYDDWEEDHPQRYEEKKTIQY